VTVCECSGVRVWVCGCALAIRECVRVHIADARTAFHSVPDRRWVPFLFWAQGFRYKRRVPLQTDGVRFETAKVQCPAWQSFLNIINKKVLSAL